MIQTYSSETSSKLQRNKSIHLSGKDSEPVITETKTKKTEPFMETELNERQNPVGFLGFNGITNADGLHSVGHHSLHSSNKKPRRLRGLSISTGVSYTNFYSKVGSPNQEFMKFNRNNNSTNNLTRSNVSLFLEKINIKIILLCGSWYLTSVLSSNVTKTILRAYKYPVTLTEIQFFITSIFCLITYFVVHKYRNIARAFPLGTFPGRLLEHKNSTLYEIIKPTKMILTQTVPMGMFQFVGHITSHNATSLISVSMVHTIKALSPIVTVLSYRFLFQIKYPTLTYVTLIPLVVGIMLTCLFKTHSKNTSSSSIISEKSNYFKGLTYAFISMLIFVSQNIFAKKILTYKTSLLNGSREDEITSPFAKHQYSNILPIDKEEQNTIKKIGDKNKIDKLTILFYCSIIGFIFTLPIYICGEVFSNTDFSLSAIDGGIFTLMIFHGLVHFIQALLAFHILGLISPVSYSIANIFKRIVVIVAALVWEAQPLNGYQGFGLILTMTGLYCYDKWGVVKKH